MASGSNPRTQCFQLNAGESWQNLGKVVILRDEVDGTLSDSSAFERIGGHFAGVGK